MKKIFLYSSLLALGLANAQVVESKKMVLIPAGKFMMGGGSDVHTLERELPQHLVSVKSFYIDETEVTNAEFAEFIKATGYITTAERPVDWEAMKQQLPPDTPKPDDDLQQPGSMVFKTPENITSYDDYTQWWSWVKDTNWRQPFGKGSNIEGKEQYPVVHISFEDANAFAQWAGKRLPTEAEWEWAARGGLSNQIYAWGNENPEQGEVRANIWDGTFPIKNTERDGYYYSAPVKSYPPNGYGLYDMSGNVWEFCSDYYRYDYDPKTPEDKLNRVIRGGSFLCNSSYCSSYRVSARMFTTEDSTMLHLGFRLVKDLEPKK